MCNPPLWILHCTLGSVTDDYITSFVAPQIHCRATYYIQYFQRGAFAAGKICITHHTKGKSLYSADCLFTTFHPEKLQFAYSRYSQLLVLWITLHLTLTILLYLHYVFVKRTHKWCFLSHDSDYMSSGRCSQLKTSWQGFVASPVANIVGPLYVFDTNWTMVAAEQNLAHQCPQNPVEGPQASAY